MTLPSEELLDELERLDKEATLLPWMVTMDEDGDVVAVIPDVKNGNVFAQQTGCDEDDNCYWHVCDLPTEKYGYGTAWGSKPNGNLIVAMRNALPQLITAARRARRYKKALEKIEPLNREGPYQAIKAPEIAAQALKPPEQG